MATTRLFSITALLTTGLVSSPGVAVAQGQQAPMFSLADMRDGDCVVTVRNVPTTLDIHQIAISLDGALLTVRPAVRSGDNVRLKLLDPLHENTIVGATVAGSGLTSNARVQQALQLEAPGTGCDDPPPLDDRAVFETSAYLGRSFDNFAPFVGNKFDRVETTSDHASQFLAGVEAQYRLIGGRGDSFQIWLSTYTLHGVRTSDVDCTTLPTSFPLCSRKGTAQERFLAILQHQTSLEAHFDVRAEFLTLQKKSELPIKVFGFSRFAFVDVRGAPKVYNADSLGAGILSPAGVFKGSSASVAWGRSQQFQSNTGWNRLKINGSLIFDVMPGFRDQLEFWKRLAGSPRVFVVMNVDRNPGGPGPDSVTTYVGIDFDLRRMFFGYGG